MSLDHSRIRVDFEEHARWRRTLSFEVPPDVVIAQRVGTPERPARASREQRLIDACYRSELERRALQPVSEGRVEAVAYTPEGGLTFRVSFDVRPVIALTRLEGFEVERPRVHVSDADLDRALHRLRVENAIWRDPENDDRPEDGDLVTLEIVRLADEAQQLQREGDQVAPTPGRQTLQDVGLPWARRLRLRPDSKLGKRFQFILGEGDALPGVEEAVRSLGLGATGDFTVQDSTAPGPLGGRPLRLRITLQDRRKRELPDLDDAFARSLGRFSGVADLRRVLRQDLEKEAKGQAEQQLRTQLLDQVLAANPFEAPESMVERYVESMLGETRDADPEAVRHARAELWPEAETAVKRMLLVDRIAESRGLGATPEEVERRIAEVAVLGQSTPDQVRARLVQTKRLAAVARDVTERKVLEWLVGQSVIVERGDSKG